MDKIANFNVTHFRLLTNRNHLIVGKIVSFEQGDFQAFDFIFDTDLLHRWRRGSCSSIKVSYPVACACIFCLEIGRVYHKRVHTSHHVEFQMVLRLYPHQKRRV